MQENTFSFQNTQNQERRKSHIKDSVHQNSSRCLEVKQQISESHSLIQLVVGCHILKWILIMQLQFLLIANQSNDTFYEYSLYRMPYLLVHINSI